MEKTLVIAEKPSVGRDLARVLECNQKKDGYIEGSKHIVTWAIGHLVTLCEPDDYDGSYKKWLLDNLPIMPDNIKLKVMDNVKKQFEIIENLMNSDKVNELICATDAGREGELIFRYIYQLAGCRKPFGRLWISSMVDKAIQDGFDNLKPGKEYDNLYESARCRSEADWLVGINATRAFTVRYNNLFSVGRVQTPTLALLVNRQEEIDNFVPRKYWEINADFGNFSGLWYDTKEKETRTYSQDKAVEIVVKVKGKTGIIKDIKEEAKKDLPPLLYDLNELQRDANKKYGFSAKKTLGLAQDLYERYKVITYPRTDSRHLTADMIPGLKNLIKKTGDSNPGYKEFSDYLLGLAKLQITRRIVDNKKVSDHHAIIPTGKISNMPLEHEKIFNLVALRFLAVFYPEHKYTVTTIESEIEKEIFISKGKTIQQEGWKVLYKKPENEKQNSDKTNKEDDNDQQTLPLLKVNDQVTVVFAGVTEKETSPPSQYTEAALLGAMENAGRFVEDEELKEHLRERGLGTPATRAGVIERLIAVGYLERKGKKLIPTVKGITLIKIVPPQLKSPEMTGEWEQRLSHIAKGRLQPDEFMKDIRKYVNFVVEDAKKLHMQPLPSQNGLNSTDDNTAGEVIAKCPYCDEGEVIARSKGYNCNRRKEGCNFFISMNILGKYLPPEQIKKIIDDGETDLIKGFTSKKGKKFNARLSFSEDGKLNFKFE